VLHWLGLSSLSDGERQWLDIAATEMETVLPTPHHRPRRLVCEV
jgi:hypothetical protein